LKFIGEQPSAQVDAITERLRRMEGSAFEIQAGGYGFFPTRKLHAYSGSEFTRDRNWQNWPRVSTLRRPNSVFHCEDRPYSPHLDFGACPRRENFGLAEMAQGRGPNTTFAVLEKRLAAMGKLDFGKMTAHEFYSLSEPAFTERIEVHELQRFALNRS